MLYSIKLKGLFKRLQNEREWSKSTKAAFFFNKDTSFFFFSERKVVSEFDLPKIHL